MPALRKIIPLSEFQSDINGWLQKLRGDNDALIITRRGRGLFVVQLPEVYEKTERMAIEGQHQYALNQALQDDEITPPPRSR